MHSANPARPPLVTAVIPTFNYGRYVAEAVGSVLGQTYPAVEAVVVDDGSTDDTPERLGPFRDRIRYLRQENQGVSRARNRGVAAARGDWVAFLDADDVWHPRKLEIQMAYLAEHPGVGLLATGHVGDVAGDWPELPEAACHGARAVTAEQLVLQSHFGSCGVVVRRDCFDAVGLFDPGLRYGEDRDMWIRIAGRYPVRVLDAPLWRYRFHGEAASSRPDRMAENHRALLDRAFASVPALRARPLLRRKALSRAAFAEAHVYKDAGMGWRAAAAWLRSVAWWPLPYHRAEVKTSLARAKTLAVILKGFLPSRGHP